MIRILAFVSTVAKIRKIPDRYFPGLLRLSRGMCSCVSPSPVSLVFGELIAKPVILGNSYASYGSRWEKADGEKSIRIRIPYLPRVDLARVVNTAISGFYGKSAKKIYLIIHSRLRGRNRGLAPRNSKTSSAMNNSIRFSPFFRFHPSESYRRHTVRLV